MSYHVHKATKQVQGDPGGRTGVHFGTCGTAELGAYAIKIGISNPQMEESADGKLVAVAELDLLDAIQAIQSMAKMYEICVRSQNAKHE